MVEALSNMINAKIDTLQFGQSHKEALSSCDELNDLISEIDVLIKDPNCYIYYMFSEFRRRVDLKSEQLKLKIDQEAQTILAELNKLESECKEKINARDKSVNLDELFDAKEDAQKQLEAYLISLNELNLDVEKWKSTNEDCHKQIELLQQKLGKFNKDLSANVFDFSAYNIEFFTQVDIDPNFQLWKFNLDSNILIDNEMSRDFVKLCEFTAKTKFELLYRGSRDGFIAKDFHMKCDCKPKTVAIVKTTKNYVFGGYTESAWNDNLSFGIDEQAFLFSLVNHEKAPIKIRISNGWENRATYNSARYGPVFGNFNNGFTIYDKCNVNECSHVNLGAYFKHPKYATGSEEANNFLAGSPYFQVAEIEVFKL